MTGLRKYTIKVNGDRPPKKKGNRSMFNEESREARHVVTLRKAAKQAFGTDRPVREPVTLTLEIHTGMGNVVSGDLDSYIAGVCDALMAAHDNAERGLHPDFRDPANADIDPMQAIGLYDDDEIVEIHAKKVTREQGAPHYEVVLEGM
jgi:hypothetical protein